MITDNQFWATVINSSANLVIAGAMVLQTFLFIATFIIGHDYLRQHRVKVLEENRQKIIIDCINLISKLSLGFTHHYTTLLGDIFDESNDQEIEIKIRTILSKQGKKDKKYPELNGAFLLLESYLKILDFRNGIYLHKKAGFSILELDNHFLKAWMFLEDNEYKKAYGIVKALSYQNYLTSTNNQLKQLTNTLSEMRDELLKFYIKNK